MQVTDLIDSAINEHMNHKECEVKCCKNCSCKDYSDPKSDEGIRGCLTWFAGLNVIRNAQQDNESESDMTSQQNSQKTILVTILVISNIIFGIVILVAVFYMIWKKAQKTAHLTGWESRMGDLEVPLFNLSTIAIATNHFSHENFIGAGGFGSVYKGYLSTGEDIAVKRLSKNSGQGTEEFWNEAILIAKLQHKNLVGLLGSCIEEEERILIYEYMTNKSLDYFIFDQKKTALLTWPKRFDIIMGIARGLLYLHQDSKLQIIHRDLKPSNILLDSDLNPKISDFGLARIFRGDDEVAKTDRIMGTNGYMSPEYAVDGIFSVKSDVFSFGVLLLEIVSGEKNRGFSHPAYHHNLLGHAWVLWNRSRALELMDPCLEDSCVKSEVVRCVQVGLLCVQKLPEERPAMSSVVFILANKEAMLPQPRQPGFFTERSSVFMEAKTRYAEPHTVNAVTITMPEGR